MSKINEIIKECQKRKYLIKQGRSCHYKVYLPNNKLIVISHTSSDLNVYKTILADFKRAGFPLNI